MISKASELLELFIIEESNKLKNFSMPHMPTLGSAYEEITKQGIDKSYSIPKNLDLMVVSGFVSVGNEMLPEQIDCMLVHGHGKKYGLTKQYIYPIEKVLCIFEVKKTLRKSDYCDAFDHLGKIRRKYAEHFEKKLISGNFEPDIDEARKNFSKITGKIAPYKYMDIHNLTKKDGILFYTLVQEALAPVSIIHGYEGYKTENGLRTVFLELLEERGAKSGKGLGVPSLPTLVTSNNFCLVKGSGIPFLTIKNTNSWIAVFSTRHNSIKMILELIWSKISTYFKIKMPFNDGLYMDSINPLLIAEPSDEGWIFEMMELREKYLKREDNNTWKPASLGIPEISTINIMAMKGGYLPVDDDVNKYLIDNFNITIKEVAENLIRSMDFMFEGDYVRPINSCTYIITNDDGTGYVSSDIDRLDMWCDDNNIKKCYLNLIFLE